MKNQDKKAEIHFMEEELEQGTWEDRKGQQAARRKQLGLLKPILPPGLLVLDGGCGPGNYGIILAEKNEVVGLDISLKAAATAKRRATKECVKFLPLAGDLERLPFKDNMFDACFAGYALHHFPDISTVMKEFVRITKPGGWVAILDPNGSNPAVRLSTIIEGLMRRSLVRRTLDTPNESVHRHGYYVAAFEREGLTEVTVSPHYSGGGPPLPSRSKDKGLSLSIIYILVSFRNILYAITKATLPSPLDGADLLVFGRKPAT